MNKPIELSLSATKEAMQLAQELKTRYSQLVFMISGGCCDNTAPMLLDGFLVGQGDVHLGEIAGIGVYASKEHAKTLSGSGLIIGVRKATGGGGFSLETPLGLRFCLTTYPLEDPKGLNGHQTSL